MKTNISKEEFIIAVNFILIQPFFRSIKKFINKYLAFRWIYLFRVIAHNCRYCNARSWRGGDHKITNTIIVLFLICWWYPSCTSNMINSTLNIFNSLYTRIQFTMNVGVDGMCFLDTIIIIDNQRIIFDTYHKVIFFSLISANHPLCHKRGTIISFLDKIFYPVYPRFQ